MADQANLRILIALGVVALFGIITFALAAATLGTLNKRLDEVGNKQTNIQNSLREILQRLNASTTQPTTTTTQPVVPSSITTAQSVPATATEEHTTLQRSTA